MPKTKNKTKKDKDFKEFQDYVYSSFEACLSNIQNHKFAKSEQDLSNFYVVDVITHRLMCKGFEDGACVHGLRNLLDDNLKQVSKIFKQRYEFNEKQKTTH